jgi:hypothetical protein
MRWDAPFWLALLLVLPLLAWRARRPAARGAAVLWVRLGVAVTLVLAGLDL